MSTGSQTHPAFQLLDNRCFFSKDKWPGREYDHWTPSTAEITLNFHPHIFATRGL